MAKMTKNKKKTAKKTLETKRAKLLGKIYSNLENMLDLFSSSAAEHYSTTQLDIFVGELEDTHNLAVTCLHERLKTLGVTSGSGKKVAARRR